MIKREDDEEADEEDGERGPTLSIAVTAKVKRRPMKAKWQSHLSQPMVEDLVVTGSDDPSCTVAAALAAAATAQLPVKLGLPSRAYRAIR